MSDRSTWAVDRRLDFIDWRLLTAGAIRREDIVSEFRVSMSQATNDLTAFQRLYPEAIRYDLSAKTYLPAGAKYRPVRQATQLLADPKLARAWRRLGKAGHPMAWAG